MSLAGATETSIYKYGDERYVDRGTTTKIIEVGTPGGDNVSSVGNFCRGLCFDRSGLPLQYVVGLYT